MESCGRIAQYQSIVPIWNEACDPIWIGILIARGNKDSNQRKKKSILELTHQKKSRKRLAYRGMQNRKIKEIPLGKDASPIRREFFVECCFRMSDPPILL